MVITGQILTWALIRQSITEEWEKPRNGIYGLRPVLQNSSHPRLASSPNGESSAQLLSTRLIFPHFISRRESVFPYSSVAFVHVFQEFHCRTTFSWKLANLAIVKAHLFVHRTLARSFHHCHLFTYHPYSMMLTGVRSIQYVVGEHIVNSPFH